MRLVRLAAILFPLTLALGQPCFDYMLHPERLSWPLEGNVVHFSSWATNGSNSDLGYYYGTAADGWQTLCDIQGPGVITDMWWTQDNQTSQWRWRLYVDNMSTALIDTPLVYPFGEMSPFLPPIADSSSGGYYSYLPIPFQNRVRITYNDFRDIYFHITAMKYPPGTQIESFTMPPSAAYTQRLDSLAARLSTPQTPIYVPYETAADCTAALAPGSSMTAYDRDLSGRTRRFMLRMANRTQSVFENFWVRVYTDGNPLPDIECPISAAFGTPLGWRPYRSVVTGSVGDTLYFNLPITTDRHLRIEFENRTAASQPFTTHVETVSGPVGPYRLHGQYREMEPTRLWSNYLIADFQGPGNFVGTVQDMQQNDNHVLEGDETFYIDGESVPSWHGTGTEDYYKGGRYWTPVYTQLPLHGCVAYLADTAAAYRWHNNDPIPFDTHLRYETEVGRFNNLSGHYRTMAFAYLKRPKWQAVDGSGDHASHAGEAIEIIGNGIDPEAPLYGVQLGDSFLLLSGQSLPTVGSDSIFFAKFYIPDSLPAGTYPLLIMTESGYDTIDAAWHHLGGPTVSFLPVRTDISNVVYAGDTIAVEVHGLIENETVSMAVDGIPCPFVSPVPFANSFGKLSGKIRVPDGLTEGDYPVTTTPQLSSVAASDSLLHYRYWFRVEAEVLHQTSWSGARIKEEWCRDWIRSDNTDPWGRMSAYVLTGSNATSFVNLPFWSPSTGDFQAAYFFGKTSGAAIVTVQVNGVNSIVSQDLYQNTLYQSWVRSDTIWGGIHHLNQGYNLLTLRTVGKNPSSDNWKAILDQVYFVTTAPDPAPQIVEDVVISIEDDNMRLTWRPVTVDIQNNPITPFAYDILCAAPEDSFWSWKAETSGSDTTWISPVGASQSMEFAVAARRSSYLPTAALPREKSRLGSVQDRK